MSFYYKPRIDRELLEKYSEGIIAIAPSFSNDILTSLETGNKEQALERLDWYKNIFAGTPDAPNFYIEITHHPEIKGHEENMKKMLAFARETNTPIVANQDVYYIDKEDRIARETMIAIQSQNDDKVEEGTDDFSFINQKTAEKYFKHHPT
jgi:DNA polymerase-3 subunit alpha